MEEHHEKKHEAHHEKKHEEHHEKKVSGKKQNPWMYSTIAMVVLLVIVVAAFSLNGSTTVTNQVSAQEAANKAVNFINDNLLQDGTTAELVSAEDDGDLYNVEIEISGQEYDSYVTKDGRMLFTTGIDLNEVSETPTTQPSETQTNQVDVSKSEKPEVELFVMSYCPYGNQMEKGILPVVKELGDKIDFELKFVNYAMHPTKGEVEEQLNQYCIQRDYNDKYLDYLGKFLEAGDGEEALSTVGLSEADISQCVEETDKEFDVLKNLEDKASWASGRFPQFLIHDADNKKYGVRGSPTLVINGQTVSSGRDAQSLLNTVCSAFTSKPEECNSDMTSFGSPAPGFGFDTQGGSATAAGCGA